MAGRIIIHNQAYGHIAAPVCTSSRRSENFLRHAVPTTLQAVRNLRIVSSRLQATPILPQRDLVAFMEHLVS